MQYSKRFLLLSVLCSNASLSLGDTNIDFVSFVQGVLRDFERVGAIAQCSAAVSREIIKHIDTVASRDQPIRALEAGGGCGALTVELEKKLNQLNVDYILDVVEIDPEYAEILSKKFEHNPRVRIHCADMSVWNPGYQYDIIISTLPFTSLPCDLVITIVDQFKKLVKNEGFVSYLEYIFFARLKLAYLELKDLLVDAHKDEFEAKIKVLSRLRKEFGIESKHVLLNIMPAHVHHLKMTHKSA